MKILDLTDFYSDRGGGIRSHLDAKARALSRLGVEHVTVAPGVADRDEIVPNTDVGTPARVVRVRGPAQPWDRNYYFLSRLAAAAAVVHAARPDVLELDSLYFAALVARRVPRAHAPIRTAFWHSDHVDTLLFPPLARRLGQRAARRIVTPGWVALRAILSGMDATIVTSQSQREKLLHHGVPRVHYLPFGVDRSCFRPERRSERLRRELLGPDRGEGLLFLAVGRLSVEKRWPVVIDAFRTVRAQRSAVLLLLGEGPERPALERRAAGHRDIRFLGHEADRERYAAILASADFLLHACPYETFGLGVAEAVASGLPVVVPDAGAAGEFATGASAESYAAEQPEACVAAIERLLDRPPGVLRQAARDAAERIGTMEDHFAGLLQLYRELGRRAADRRPPRDAGG